MAIIEDKDRAFNTTDYNGKVTVQDIVDTVGAGDAVLSVEADVGSGLAAAASLQALAVALSARIKALEDAA